MKNSIKQKESLFAYNFLSIKIKYSFNCEFIENDKVLYKHCIIQIIICIANSQFISTSRYEIFSCFSLSFSL